MFRRHRPIDTRAILAFAAIYVIWGSTYLAIRFMVDTLPPFCAAGTRFLVAGTLLSAWSLLRGERLTSPQEWAAPAVVGLCLLAGTNGCTTWSSRLVPSGVVALLQATVPLWFVLLDSVWLRQEASGLKEWLAVFFGIAGVGLLLFSAPGRNLAFDGRALVALLTGAFLWSAGSLLSRRLPSPQSNALASGLAMVIGGAVLTTLSGLRGEWHHLSWQGMSPKSLLALAYLILFGSILAFCSYNWLIRTKRPTLVGTCTFVNPLVAVLLGWSLAGEELSLQALLGGVVIVASVVLLWTSHRAKDLPRPTTISAKTS